MRLEYYWWCLEYNTTMAKTYPGTLQVSKMEHYTTPVWLEIKYVLTTAKLILVWYLMILTLYSYYVNHFTICLWEKFPYPDLELPKSCSLPSNNYFCTFAIFCFSFFVYPLSPVHLNLALINNFLQERGLRMSYISTV